MNQNKAVFNFPVVQEVIQIIRLETLFLLMP